MTTSAETPDGDRPRTDDGPRAILLASGTSKAASVHGRTEAVTPMAVRVRLPRDLNDPELGSELRTPRELTAWVRRRLGEGSRLGLIAGSDTVWCGSVRLVGTEIPEDSNDEFIAVFALENPLSAADQRVLGLTVEEEDGEKDFASMRAAERVSVDMPVEVLTSKGAVVGTAKDLSSTGMRVHMQADDLGFPATADMSELARGLADRLGTRFVVNLNHIVLGSLLAQSVQMTRVCAAGSETGIVELGGRFVEPLAPEAAAMLGVSLPAPGETTEQAEAREAPPAPYTRVVDYVAPKPKPKLARKPEPAPQPVAEAAASDVFPDLDLDDASPMLGPCVRRMLRAQVSCKAAGAPPGTTCTTETLGMGGIIARMARSCVGAAAPGDEANILLISKRFTEVFGDEVTLKLHDGAIHLWSGPARVVAIHLPVDKPDSMLVTFAFARNLNPSEITRLGLARLAG